MNKKNSPSIKSLALIYISIPVVLLGVALSYVWNAQSRDSVERISAQYITQIHSLVQSEIDEIVAIPPRIASINKTMLEEGFLRVDDLDSWLEIFKEEFNTFHWLSSIVWGSSDGRALWIGRYSDGKVYWALKEDSASDLMFQWILNDDGNIIPETKGSFKYDLHSRPWFIGPSESGQPQWTKPFVWAGGENSENLTVGIAYGIPIYDDSNKLLGIMNTDLSLNDLSSYLKTINIGKTGKAIIVSSGGSIIASSSSLDNVRDDGELQTLTDADDLIANSTAQFLNQLEGNQDEKIATGVIEVDEDSLFIASSSLGSEVGLDWNLITVVPKSDFLAEIDRSFFNSAVVSFIFLLISIVLGFFASKWLIRPLIELAQFTKSVNKDSLYERITLKHTREYEELADSINGMLKSLDVSSKKQLDLSSELNDRIFESERLESRLGAIIDSTLNSIITINSKSQVVDLNKVSEQMFGYSREEAIGQSIADLIIPENFREAHNRGMAHYMQTGEGPVLNTAIEVSAIKKSGEEFPIKMEVVPFVMNDASFFTATIQDITLAKEQEEKLKLSRDHETILNRELDHRVKNMLAQIVSICRQSVNKATTDKVLLEDLTSRVAGIASIHELLASNKNIPARMKDLVKTCLKPYAGLEMDDLLSFDGVDISLNSKSVLCIGMVLNELANNSFKYGSLSNRCGHVSINWSLEENEGIQHLNIEWVEQHQNPMPESITGGLGSQVIRFAIPHELDGQSNIFIEGNIIRFSALIPYEIIQ
ncbi:MAG: hypothetical protein CMJ26_06850 [Phycisphaerae bacterium]|nr:hypothetical protein [Phycisphaerae bacterium]